MKIFCRNCDIELEWPDPICMNNIMLCPGCDTRILVQTESVEVAIKDDSLSEENTCTECYGMGRVPCLVNFDHVYLTETCPRCGGSGVEPELLRQKLIEAQKDGKARRIEWVDGGCGTGIISHVSGNNFTLNGGVFYIARIADVRLWEAIEVVIHEFCKVVDVDPDKYCEKEMEMIEAMATEIIKLRERRPEKSERRNYLYVTEVRGKKAKCPECGEFASLNTESEVWSWKCLNEKCTCKSFEGYIHEGAIPDPPLTKQPEPVSEKEEAGGMSAGDERWELGDRKSEATDEDVEITFEPPDTDAPKCPECGKIADRVTWNQYKCLNTECDVHMFTTGDWCVFDQPSNSESQPPDMAKDSESDPAACPECGVVGMGLDDNLICGTEGCLVATYNSEGVISRLVIGSGHFAQQ